MSDTEDKSDLLIPAENTAQHEQVLSEYAKRIVGVAMDLAFKSLLNGGKYVDTDAKDPLHSERYFQVSTALMHIAECAYSIGEAARTTSEAMYLNKKRK